MRGVRDSLLQYDKVIENYRTHWYQFYYSVRISNYIYNRLKLYNLAF